jgi:AcrR family transcriptional regulator
LSKTKILDVAFDLFSKGHYNSVALSEIAEKSGIKKSSIYAHFASKEDLFIEVFDSELNRVHENLHKILNDNRDNSIEIILQQLLIKSVEYMRENAPIGGFWAYLLFVTSHDLPHQIIIRIKNLKNFIEKLFLKLIIKGIDNGEIVNENPDSLVYLYFCILQGNLLMELNSKLFHMNKVNESWSYLWEGVRKKG